MTLTEIMVAVAIAGLILGATASIWAFGARSFVAIGNYVDLDAKSRGAVDVMTREIRTATGVVDFMNTASNRWLLLTNSAEGSVVRYSWNSSDRTVTAEKSGAPKAVLLTECDNWDFQVFQRTPVVNLTNVFHLATNYLGAYDPPICKTISMTWKCSRTILGQKVNTESVQTTQVVLRNKT